MAVFKKHSGFYFWSFCVVTWGVPAYSIGFLFLGLGVNPDAVNVTRKGCVSDVEAAAYPATAARDCRPGQEPAPEDGIRVVWTTEVNVARDDDFGRPYDGG
ncbi:hypothetical protein ACRALDRAFT_2026736 [Sodiomyces alcalophilus JCM 7366]|uniref:uncharacterized protein n=1 Tax=Sodiomyces alcalophilus JCM 7366 TaxID=591952 RepID=UPI0039B38F1A